MIVATFYEGGEEEEGNYKRLSDKHPENCQKSQTMCCFISATFPQTQPSVKSDTRTELRTAFKALTATDPCMCSASSAKARHRLPT